MFKYVRYIKVETEHTVLEFRGDAEDVEVFHFDGGVVSIKSEDEDAIDRLIDSQADDIECEVIEKDMFISLIKSSSRYKRILKRVEESYNKEMNLITSNYPQVERETWTLQLEQAKKYKDSGDEADAPFLKVLADADGLELDDMADTVILKAKSYENFSALALVNKRAYKKELLDEFGA